MRINSLAFNLFSHNARGGVDGLKMTNLSFSLSLSLCLCRLVLDIVIFLNFKFFPPTNIRNKFFLKKNNFFIFFYIIVSFYFILFIVIILLFLKLYNHILDTIFQGTYIFILSQNLSPSSYL